MNKYLTSLCSLLILALIAACGNSGSNLTATTTYSLPASLAPSDTHMGGAVQGGTFSAKFANYSVATLAGSAGIPGFVPGISSVARFNQPVGIATDGPDLYVADYKNNLIRKINIASQTVTNLAGSGSAGYADGLAAAATFNAPASITVSGNYLYVTDTANNMIRRIDKTSGAVSFVAGSTSGLVGAVDSTVPADARFNYPTGITTDGVNLYVTDSGNHTIRRIDIATSAVYTMAGSPGSPGSADGAKDAARFNQPARITTDGKKLYVTDFNNRMIRQLDIVSGTVTTLAGTSGALGLDDGTTDATGTAARFNQPNGITTDGTNLYVTDSYQNTIRKIVISTGVVTTLSGISKPSSDPTIGTGGAADSPGVASFYTPIGITTDGVSLFIADSFNHTIRKLH